MSSIDRFSAEATRTYLSGTDTARTPATQTPAAEQPRSESGRRPDSISLSTTARQLAAARAEVDKAPDTRELKVAAIKQQIETGTYDVPAHVLARKMVQAAHTTP